MNEPGRFFGPSALLTPANALTLARLVGAPVLAVLTVEIGPASWLLWALWTVFCLSDSLDGHVARATARRARALSSTPWPTSSSCSARMITLAAIGASPCARRSHRAPRGRDERPLRVIAGRRGISSRRGRSAKLKTLVQDLAIAGAFSHRSDELTSVWSASSGSRALIALHRARVLPRCPPGPAGPLARAPDAGRPRGVSNREGRGRRGRHRAAARPDRRHQLDLAGRAARRHRRRLALPSAVGDNLAVSAGPAHRASPGATASSSAAVSGRPRTTSPGRPSPPHGRRARPRRGASSAHRRAFGSRPRADVAEQRAAGGRAGGGAIIDQVPAPPPGSSARSVSGSSSRCPVSPTR